MLLLLRAIVYGQQSAEYTGLAKQANDQYRAKQYKEAAATFSKVFAAGGGKGTIDDRYTAACAWTHAGNNDSAFFNLNRIANAGGYSYYYNLFADPDLAPLHTDKRWNDVMAIVKQNRDKGNPKLNKALVDELDTINIDDQADRIAIKAIQKKYGFNSKEEGAIWKIIKTKDSINLIKIKRILDKYGWVGPDIAGEEGNNTIWGVIQHADVKTQQQYLPIIREALKAGNAKGPQVAMLEDRVAMRTGKKQIYGSQVINDKAGNYYIGPLEDPDNVDKRRAEVGLGPIATYAKRWNIIWDVEEYKKQLPKIEEVEKEMVR
jgi:hypothetical protein